jgi:hypothetical protein
MSDQASIPRPDDTPATSPAVSAADGSAWAQRSEPERSDGERSAAHADPSAAGGSPPRGGDAGPKAH